MAGVEFIDENDGGPGVRVRKRPQAKPSKALDGAQVTSPRNSRSAFEFKWRHLIRTPEVFAHAHD